MHTYQGVRAKQLTKDTDGMWTMAQASDTGAASIEQVFSEGGCSKACIEQQIKSQHAKMGVDEKDQMPAVPSYKQDENVAKAEASWAKYDKKTTEFAERASKSGSR